MTFFFFRLSPVCVLLMLFANSAGAQDLKLNELMASNNLAVFDDFFESDDWVEIYNAGGLIDLAGYHISDDPNNLTKFTFPDTDPGNTFLTPGSHALVWCDNDSVQGVMHANFKLSAEDEGVWLTSPDGVTVIDSIVYPPQQTDLSYGRSCDGCEDWVFFDVPTPEESNMNQVVATPYLVFNEVLLDNTVNLLDEQFEADPWIEVYNPNSFQVHLGGYTMASSEGWSAVIPADSPVETTVPAGGFLLFWMDGQPEQGGHHLDALASPVAQTFTLVGVDGEVANSYDAEVSFANVSWGRTIDGGPTSDWFDVPTPRVTNQLLVVPASELVVNELCSVNSNFIADNHDEFDDWVEIHNPSNAPIDLAGHYLTDRLNNPVKWQVPLDAGDSTVIEPGGYVLLWADEDGSQGWNHMNFRLNSAGEAVVLRSPDGFTMVDSVHFGMSQTDATYSRLPNATGAFQWTTEVTPGACNDCPIAVQELPEESQFYLGANPTRVGASFWTETGFDLVGMDGRWVASVEAGSHVIPELSAGIWILQGASGGTKRLVILAQD